MHIPYSIRKPLAAVLFSGLIAAQLSADSVETKNGARIIVKITKLDAGSVVVSTDFAGTITIKQSEVATLSTDAPVAIRLESGTRMEGRVTSGAAGAIQVAGPDGTISTT